jgi:hypothetical protein
VQRVRRRAVLPAMQQVKHFVRTTMKMMNVSSCTPQILRLAMEYQGYVVRKQAQHVMRLHQKDMLHALLAVLSRR